MQPTILPNITEKIEQLSTDEKYRLIEYVIHSLRQEHQSAPNLSWSEFITNTYGSLADDPLERPAQGEYEQRDQLQ